MRQEPILVLVWTKGLQLLEKISLFYVIRRYILPNYTKNNVRFVDRWLIGHTLLSILYMLIANLPFVPNWLKYGLLIYGCLRMFEILIYQLNVILVHPFTNKNYSLNSYRRMTIALIHNFFEIIFWFAGSYIVLQFISTNNILSALYSSFTQMVSFSFTLEDSKWSFVSFFILLFQAIIGLFMTVLSLARFVSLFPQPQSNDIKEKGEDELSSSHIPLIEKLMELENNNKALIQKNCQLIEQNALAIEKLTAQYEILVKHQEQNNN